MTRYREWTLGINLSNKVSVEYIFEILGANELLFKSFLGNTLNSFPMPMRDWIYDD
jgi:hypothetical protein